MLRLHGSPDDSGCSRRVGPVTVQLFTTGCKYFLPSLCVPLFTKPTPGAKPREGGTQVVRTYTSEHMRAAAAVVVAGVLAIACRCIGTPVSTAWREITRHGDIVADAAAGKPTAETRGASSQTEISGA